MPSWDVVFKLEPTLDEETGLGWPDISNLALKSNQGQSLNLHRSAFGGQIYFDAKRVKQRVLKEKLKDFSFSRFWKPLKVFETLQNIETETENKLCNSLHTLLLLMNQETKENVVTITNIRMGWGLDPLQGLPPVPTVS